MSREYARGVRGLVLTGTDIATLRVTPAGDRELQSTSVVAGDLRAQSLFGLGLVLDASRNALDLAR